MNQRERAELFYGLHHEPKILVLPNAWDAASARLFEEAGFPAVATTSAGLANAFGYPDGGLIPRDDLAFMIRRITETVSVPVTVDIEAGLGDTTDDILATVRAVLEAGAVGFNIEDSRPGREDLVDAQEQADLLRAIRGLGDSMGTLFVMNARTDAFSPAVHGFADRATEAERRAKIYKEAGADCLFVPFVTGALNIASLVRHIPGPLNILATAPTPPVAELERMGVKRVSLGSGPHRATMALTRRIAHDLLTHGSYESFTEDTIPYAEANALFR